MVCASLSWWREKRNELAVKMQWDVACKKLLFSEGLGTADPVTTANSDRQ